jgi:lipopolysaccharide/colanic/teichoic acid biosynthesis glycosyltransferase
MPANALYSWPQAFGLRNSSLGHAVHQKKVELTNSAAQASPLRSPATSSRLWQVTERSNPSFETCMTLDLEYMRSWSLLLDLKILTLTVPTVLSGDGQ